MMQQVLNIICLGAVLIGIYRAVISARRLLVAQKELSKKLNVKFGDLSKFLDNKDLHSYGSVNVDTVKLKVLIEEIKQVAKELPEKQRQEVLDPFEQKSFEGRVGYLNRLLRLSGSKVNISLQY